MKKIASIPVILLMGLISCNSGSNETTPVTDSTSMHTDSSAMRADTSHSAMNMTAADALPAIPEGSKVYFKNLKEGETVSSPVKVQMGATKIAIDSAGKIRPA